MNRRDFITKVIDKLSNESSLIHDNVNEILGIFNNFFGEERVDLQPYNSLSIIIERVLDTSFSYIMSRMHRRLILSNVNADEFEYPIDIVDYIDADNEDVDRFTTYIADFVKRSDYVSRFNIIVWYPKATVSNEFDNSIEIYDLYVKIPITADGRMMFNAHHSYSDANQPFYYARTTYTINQLRAGYRHSHSRNIYGADPSFNPVPYYNEMIKWECVCTGSGPINQTIDTLHDRYDNMAWGMFCIELDKIVHIESVQGVPFIKLQSVNNQDGRKVSVSSYDYGHSSFIGDTLFFSDFIKEFIRDGNLPVCFVNGNYMLAEPFLNFLLTLSNKFIEYYNLKIHNLEDGDTKDVLKNSVNDFRNSYMSAYLIKDDGLYKSRTGIISADNLRTLIGRDCFMFKGKMLHFNIIDIDKPTLNREEFLLINPDTAEKILYYMLRVLNATFNDAISLLLYDTRHNNADLTMTEECLDNSIQRANDYRRNKTFRYVQENFNSQNNGEQGHQDNVSSTVPHRIVY